MSVTMKSVVKNNLIATGYFLVRESVSENGNPVFVLNRKVCGKSVTINLEVTKGGLWINPPKYTFQSTVSHFDFTETENRWTRRKDVIMGTVSMLQKAEIWPFIQNKNFFSVNDKCSSFNKVKNLKERVLEEFQSCLNPQVRDRKNKDKIKELSKKASNLLKR